MHLKFTINKDYLIAHTLASTHDKRFSSQKYKKDIGSFQDRAWEISEELYNYIPGRIDDTVFISSGGVIPYRKAIDKLPSYFARLAKTKEFRKIYLQTEQYRAWCEKQWEKSSKRTLRIVEELTQFRFEDDFTIFLTHPSQRNGMSFGHHQIAWGHHEDWRCYTIVYLWHEILHSYLKGSELNHALIELIADHELRYRLTGVRYPPFIGHDHLMPLKKKILPYWKRYLKSAPKDFGAFRAMMAKKFG